MAALRTITRVQDADDVGTLTSGGLVYIDPSTGKVVAGTSPTIPGTLSLSAAASATVGGIVFDVDAYIRRTPAVALQAGLTVCAADRLFLKAGYQLILDAPGVAFAQGFNVYVGDAASSITGLDSFRLLTSNNNVGVFELIAGRGDTYLRAYTSKAVRICATDRPVSTNLNREGMRVESDGTNPKLAFFGNGTSVVRPVVTGSKSSSAALASLLTQLAALGLITDSTTT